MNQLQWRQDPLSGLGTMLAFLERLSQHSSGALQETLTILYFDLVDLRAVNIQQGLEMGDRALRWLALALQDEIPVQACFRLRGDEFAAILDGCTPEQARIVAAKVQERFIRLTASQDGLLLHPRPLHLTVLHIPKDIEIQVVDILIAMESVMQQLKREDREFVLSHYPVEANANLRVTLSALIERVLHMGTLLDRAVTQAETDALTGIPNGRAMGRALQEAVEASGETADPFAIILVDGDNLRAINKISYAAGDAMIQQLATLLSQGLRSHDRIARWRLGDEFMILLPGAGESEAMSVAHRLVQSVHDASWQLPVTISAGVALYPRHGRSAEELIARVEDALNTAKEQGKNRAYLA